VKRVAFPAPPTKSWLRPLGYRRIGTGKLMARSRPMGPEIIDQQTVERLLDPSMLIDRLAQAFVALSRGEVIAPRRVALSTEKGSSLSMPAYRPGGHLMVKVVNIFDGNKSLGLPSQQSLICLFDADTGGPVAVVDATVMTTMRTAATAALSTTLLARENSKVLTIIGAGAQAEAHLRLIPLTRPLDEIRVSARRLSDAERIAALDPRAVAVRSREKAVRSSDIVSMCTSAGTPVLDAAWVAPGAHVTSVGYHEPEGELPRALLDRATLFVETRLAFEAPPGGCFELAGLDPKLGTELGELLERTKPGRTSGDQVTVFKSMGHAVEDLVACECLLSVLERRSRQNGGKARAGKTL
jgi:alanine dehydrogenase